MPQIEKVTYEKVFPLAPYVNEKIGVVYILSPTDDPKVVLQAAKDLCEEFHKESNNWPEPHIQERIIPDIQVGKSNISVDYDVVIDEINKCQTISDLDGWNIIAKGNHEAGMAFAKRAAFILSPDNKKKQLNDEEVKQIMSKTNASSKLKQLKKLKP